MKFLDTILAVFLLSAVQVTADTAEISARELGRRGNKRKGNKKGKIPPIDVDTFCGITEVFSTLGFEDNYDDPSPPLTTPPPPPPTTTTLPPPTTTTLPPPTTTTPPPPVRRGLRESAGGITNRELEERPLGRPRLRNLASQCMGLSWDILQKMCPDQNVLCDSETGVVDAFCGRPFTYYDDDDDNDEFVTGNGAGDMEDGVARRELHSQLEDVVFPCLHDGCQGFITGSVAHAPRA